MDASTFPISFTYHLIFCLIAGAFFVVQFIRLRRPYQLLLAVGIVASLLIYVGGEHNLYTVDADEFVVNKLLDRGSLSATTMVTNVQDFITIVARGLGIMD